MSRKKRRDRRKKNVTPQTPSSQHLKGAGWRTGGSDTISHSSREDTPKLVTEKVYEVLVVGAGPCSLACVSALVDPNIQSSRTYSDDINVRRRGGKRTISRDDIFVIDSSSESWLGRWKSQFELLKILQLRSIMTHHPDPFSRDSLLEFAMIEKNLGYSECGEPIPELFEEGSSRRLRKKTGRTAGRIRPVNNADRYKFSRPHVHIYNDFCDKLVEKHSLQSIIKKAVVTDVIPYEDGKKNKILRVCLQDGSELFARKVVLAVGNTCIPRLPSWMKKLRPGFTPNRCEHIWNLSAKGIKHLRTMTRNRRVLVVGGGLSAVQSTQLCMSLGAKSVTMMARRSIKLRHFDVPVSWFGSNQNVEMYRFLQSSSFERRLQLIQVARGASTVPKSNWMDFKRELNQRQSSARLLEGFEVVEITWNSVEKFWVVRYSENREHLTVHSANAAATRTMEVDYILLATGSEVSVEKHPLLGKIMKHTSPSDIVGGLPVLSSELRWRQDVDIFVTGGYAALQLGPFAHTLVGAQRGASLLRDAIYDQSAPHGSQRTPK